ncbi:MAG TPA: stage II sporulation protein M [Longimicrobiales bacterium]|nr:stage II sporulation protein M [Longimicrobiales bacterium]
MTLSARASGALRAVRRARLEILTVGLVYAVSVGVGGIMAHRGSAAALEYRDRLVARAHRADRASIAYAEGRRLEAALVDFGQNLVVGAVPETITGLTVVSPYLFAGYRGWVGGIVSVDRNHRSRLRGWRSGVYYVLTMLLQLVPYALAGGVGVRLGLSYFRAYEEYRGERTYLGYPAEALRDAARAYLLIAPLFLIASLWEFLSPWS